MPVVRTPDGFRALSKERPISSTSVERYLQGKFGDDLELARRAMEKLARSLPPRELAVRAYHLYEQFRPEIPAGVRGWWAAGASLTSVTSRRLPSNDAGIVAFAHFAAQCGRFVKGRRGRSALLQERLTTRWVALAKKLQLILMRADNHYRTIGVAHDLLGIRSE